METLSSFVVVTIFWVFIIVVASSIIRWCNYGKIRVVRRTDVLYTGCVVNVVPVDDEVVS